MGIDIDRPAEQEKAPAAPSGTGPRIICAQGPVGESRDEFKEITVYAYIYTGHVNGDPDPPPGARSTTPPGDQWYFADLVIASCGNVEPFPPYTLKVWARAAGTTLSSKRHHIYSKCANYVECGTPPAELRAGSGVALLLATAPLQWALGVADFLGRACADFNGQWLLNLRETAGSDCVWDNGGDGAERPLVELRCEGPLASIWRLRFRHNGTAIEYTRPGAEWNGLGPNVFTTLARNGNGSGEQTQDRYPTSITVVPV